MGVLSWTESYEAMSSSLLHPQMRGQRAIREENCVKGHNWCPWPPSVTSWGALSSGPPDPKGPPKEPPTLPSDSSGPLACSCCLLISRGCEALTGESKLILRVTGGIARSRKAWRWRLRAPGEQGVYTGIKYLNKPCPGQSSPTPTPPVGLHARTSPLPTDLKL